MANGTDPEKELTPSQKRKVIRKSNKLTAYKRKAGEKEAKMQSSVNKALDPNYSLIGSAKDKIKSAASTIKADIHLRKSLGIFGSGDGDYDSLESAYCQLAEYDWDDISSGETELQLQDSQDLAKVPLDAVIGTCNKPRLGWDATPTFGAERMLVRSVDYKYNKM